MTAPVLAPCLPDCDYATERDADLARPSWRSHVCVVTVGFVEVEDTTTPAVVEVARFLDADGNTDPARIEVRSADGAVRELCVTPRGALALSAALTEAANLIGATR